ncbi:type VII secretion target [Solwaraspora sp. WMMD1047]|uniref:type VII secretion target n=1 Tax=Solwaraspora sp. WMMD1047 TaxID=3016102 RepID=UPI00241725B2|nr:type VII secretion target [Solwaraspora sp. WMMD1047]MDG4833397.1 type VII secretion target [Solwaraspora sp. WMMD1047]
MNPVAGVGLTPEQIRAHAGTVEDLAERLDHAAGAARTVMLDRAAYGQLCAVWPMILEPIQQRIVAASQTAAESLDRAGMALRAAANSYVESDDGNAIELDTTYSSGR